MVGSRHARDKKAKMAKPKKVNLATIDKDFDDIILSGYSGLIFEKQHHIDTSDPQQKVYNFLNLNFSELFRFLPKYRKMYEFEVRDKKGDFIEINRIKRKYKPL